MKRTSLCLLLVFVVLTGITPFEGEGTPVEKGEYLLMGDIKEGWKVFNQKKCIQCHSIWGEGGKGGLDLGTLPNVYVSQSQLAALIWNHGPEMWGRMIARKIPRLKIDKKEMSDLFAFLYFIRYMDEPGSPQRGKQLMEAKSCNTCHTIKDRAQGDLSRWSMYVNPILWAQMMWNHAPQMEQEMQKRGIARVNFRGKEMVDLIAYIRDTNPRAERAYLSPGDPRSGETLFGQKGCVQCHTPRGELDLSRKKDFPKTLAQLAGIMWNHSYAMWKKMEEIGIPRPSLSPQEMADVIAFLFATRYFDEPGDPGRGKAVFLKKQCNLCHAKGTKAPNLSSLKGNLSPIMMAQALWNHGPDMLEEMQQSKVSWQKIDGMEMVDLMEYLNRGMP